MDKAIEAYEKLLTFDDFEFKDKLQEGIRRLKYKKEAESREKEEKNVENQKSKRTKTKPTGN